MPQMEGGGVGSEGEKESVGGCNEGEDDRMCVCRRAFHGNYRFLDPKAQESEFERYEHFRP